MYSVTSPVTDGTLNLNSDGTYTYLNNPGFLSIDSFDYEVCLPPAFTTCDQATVTLEVTLS